MRGYFQCVFCPNDFETINLTQCIVLFSFVLNYQPLFLQFTYRLSLAFNLCFNQLAPRIECTNVVAFDISRRRRTNCVAQCFRCTGNNRCQSGRPRIVVCAASTLRYWIRTRQSFRQREDSTNSSFVAMFCATQWQR